MENNPGMLECEGAAERTGLYYTCVNSYLSADEVAYIVNDCQARVVVTLARPSATWPSQLPALCPGVERWLMVDAGTAEAGTSVRGRRSPAVRADPGRRRAARRGHALLVGHHRPAQGHPAAPARRRTRASRCR